MKRGSFNSEMDVFKQIIISDYMDDIGVDYRRTHGSSGPQLNVRHCPQCGGDHYKVFINANTGLGNCFSGSCQKKYNLYEFIKATYGFVSYKDVVNEAKRHVKNYKYISKPTRSKIQDPMKSILIIPSSVELPLNGKNLKYLSERGISSKMAKRYGLRFSKNGIFNYNSIEGDRITQDYADRVIIPIRDIGGDIQTFQGRDITNSKSKPYLFPPGLPSTSKYLYGGDLAVGKKEIIICEGAFDVWSADKALSSSEIGVVGSFGMSLTLKSYDGYDTQRTQLNRLKVLGMEQVNIMWDGSFVAVDKAIDMALELHKIGFTASVTMLPMGFDPNEITVEQLKTCYNDRHYISKLTAPRVKIKARDIYHE